MSKQKSLHFIAATKHTHTLRPTRAVCGSLNENNAKSRSIMATTARTTITATSVEISVT